MDVRFPRGGKFEYYRRDKNPAASVFRTRRDRRPRSRNIYYYVRLVRDDGIQCTTRAHTSENGERIRVVAVVDELGTRARIINNCARRAFRRFRINVTVVNFRADENNNMVCFWLFDGAG